VFFVFLILTICVFYVRYRFQWKNLFNTNEIFDTKNHGIFNFKEEIIKVKFLTMKPHHNNRSCDDNSTNDVINLVKGMIDHIKFLKFDGDGDDDGCDDDADDDTIDSGSGGDDDQDDDDDDDDDDDGGGGGGGAMSDDDNDNNNNGSDVGTNQNNRDKTTNKINMLEQAYDYIKSRGEGFTIDEVKSLRLLMKLYEEESRVIDLVPTTPVSQKKH